jgi:hypothetical protein
LQVSIRESSLKLISSVDALIFHSFELGGFDESGRHWSSSVTQELSAEAKDVGGQSDDVVATLFREVNAMLLKIPDEDESSLKSLLAEGRSDVSIFQHLTKNLTCDKKLSILFKSM